MVPAATSRVPHRPDLPRRRMIATIADSCVENLANRSSQLGFAIRLAEQRPIKFAAGSADAGCGKARSPTPVLILCNLSADFAMVGNCYKE